MIIIVDTREKKNVHVTDYFDAHGIEWKSLKLDFGDYAIEGKENLVAIERKGSLDELAGNFTRGRERFKREFERATENNAHIVLMVEASGYEAIMKGRYRSKFSPNAFYASMKSWEERYRLEIEFKSKRSAGKFISDKLKEWDSNE